MRPANADPLMLEILDLHSQGYTLTEACEQAGVDAGYWTNHRRKLFDALGALNEAQAVRRALQRRLIRETAA